MATHRFFYVTQEDLVVWYERRGMFQEVKRFSNTDEGLRGFSSYLKNDSQAQSLMLVDVIEEEFSADTIPKLPVRDRTALINRRLSRKYSRTPYRIGHYQGLGRGKSGNQEVLYSAVSNQELLDPWLEIVMAQSTPLVGIHSVSLLGAQLLSKVRKPAGHALLMSQHQGDKLRQVYLRDGKLKSARLSQSPLVTDDRYGNHIFDEILRSRRYLERSRLLGGLEDIDVYMITDSATADRIIASDKGKMPLHFHFIKPEVIAKAVKMQQVPEIDRLEALYLSVAARGRTGHNYALNGETRFHRLGQARRVIIGAALAASVVCSVFAGLHLTSGFALRGAIATLDQQIDQMEETFRRENERFAPVRADSHEMKLAVDTGDFILANRLPASWVMEQLSRVLGDYPQIQIDELRWRAEMFEDLQSTNGARRRGSGPEEISVKPLQAVTAEVYGQIIPFNGNMREAFKLIERLESSLRGRTAFRQVVTTEFPLDPSPESSLSGDVVNRGGQQYARFRMDLRLNVANGEDGDEAD